jgi:Lrp/AsnC family transcriptional regulator for asnA, asnC and gidA
MPCALDPVDWQIIRILQQDGRTSNMQIARQVGVSETTVRKRLERMLSAQTIRIAAIPNANRLGFHTTAFMMLSVDLASVSQIADQIARLPEVRTIHLIAGASELVVEAWFTSSEALLCFMTEHIGSISGIQKATTSHVLRTIKDGSEWVLPATSPALRSGSD